MTRRCAVPAPWWTNSTLVSVMNDGLAQPLDALARAMVVEPGHADDHRRWTRLSNMDATRSDPRYRQDILSHELR